MCSVKDGKVKKKKNLTISEKRIRANENKKKINILELIVSSILVLVLLVTDFLRSSLQLNSGVVNTALLK